ncbi:type II secretion system F family protein, partial [Achromobacter xylosoxidans]
MHILQSWNASTVLAMALMLVAAGLVVLGLGMARRLRSQGRSRQVVDQALAARDGAKAPAAARNEGGQGRLAA